MPKRLIFTVGTNPLPVRAAYEVLKTQEATVTLVHGSESLTYGADWLLLSSEAGGVDTVGTCSFYNKEFRVWTA